MCKIIEIKDRGVEIRTPRELLDEIPDIDELICAEGYTRLDMDSCLCQIDVKKTLNNAGIKFEETFMGYVVTANSGDVELALKLNKLVHDECKDVPHDIGLRLLDIVKKNLEFEQPKDTLVSKIKQRIESEYRKHPDLDWAEIAARKIYAGIVNPK